MYLRSLYEPGATAHRVRYALTTICRDRTVNEGAFNLCFQMEDRDTVIRTILLRGLRSRNIRTALERSHLIDINSWLMQFPDLLEAYWEVDPGEPSSRNLPRDVERYVPAGERLHRKRSNQS